MKGTLYIQRYKGRRIDKPKALECEIDMRKGGTTIAGMGRDVKATLHRSEVEFISANGLMIRGVEEHGFDLLYYQEWWFIPVVAQSSKE